MPRKPLLDDTPVDLDDFEDLEEDDLPDEPELQDLQDDLPDLSDFEGDDEDDDGSLEDELSKLRVEEDLERMPRLIERITPSANCETIRELQEELEDVHDEVKYLHSVDLWTTLEKMPLTQKI